MTNTLHSEMLNRFRKGNVHDPYGVLRSELAERFRGRKPATFGAEILNMQPSVRAAFVNYISPFEGKTNFMYTDSKGLVTTGIGNLIDPVSVALTVPWKNPDGSLADSETVQAEWQLVKNSFPGVQSFADESITKLRISEQDIQNLVESRLKDDEFYLMGQLNYPGYTDWPADAQLGLLDMAWNMGAGFNFPKFKAAANAQDFATAAVESHCSNCDAKRNAAHGLQFNNAAQVVSQGLDRSVLYYPSTPVTTPSGGRIGGVVAVIAAASIGILYHEEIGEFGRKVYSKIRKGSVVT
jgi:GH24 family phage-related lysozyme (muramidase)